MDKTVTVTRDQLVAIFSTWNKQATDEKWDCPPKDCDPHQQADHFLGLAQQFKQG